MVANGSKDGAVRFPREVLKAGWKDLRTSVESSRRLKFRDAANIVGFATNPLGWRWEEYAPSEYSPQRDIEKSLSNKRLLGIIDLPASLEGKRAIQQGMRFRQNAVSLRLLELVKTGATGLVLYDERMRATVASGDFLCDGTLRIEIETSSVFAQNLGFDCMIDGFALLTELERSLPWNKRLGKHDWFLIERRIRRWIDSVGCPRTSQEITAWYLNGPIKAEPPKSSLDELASRLFKEHSSAEYKAVSAEAHLEYRRHPRVSLSGGGKCRHVVRLCFWIEQR